MKKLIVSLSAVAALLAVLLTATQTRGQQGGAQAGAPRQARPHQIGLIDMAYVFNNYQKFKDLQEGVQAGLKSTQDQAQKLIDQMKAEGERIKSGEIKQDSPEYRQIEAKLIGFQAQLDAMGKVAQADNLRKEAEIYKQIYLEVQENIKIYANAYGYTLIIRFDRENVADSTDPQQVLQRLTRQVVYHRSEDDLTEVILNHMNAQYAKTSGRPANTATAPAGGATR